MDSIVRENLMKKFALILTTGLLLAACGSQTSDKQYLVDKCVSEGEAQETCDCVVTAMENNLDDKTFAKLVDAAKSGGDPDAAMEEIMGDMSDPEDMQKIMALGLEVMQCNPDGLKFE